MKIERSKAWWLSRIEREGDGPVEAGLLARDTVPGGVGDSGLDPFPDDARVKALAPLRLVLVAFKDGDRWAGEVHGYTTDVDTGKPTRIRTRGHFADEPTPEDMHGLLTTWFDHEIREQLGMNPHGK